MPLVSICCPVYNNERYLEECLESILKQKTTFKYEIIIHDDASTDKSPEIILDYCQRYPEVFNPLLQTENQYSKGKRILPILFENVSGKYIAICEGDDYWTDPLKLQKQVDYMEAHPECSMCFGNAIAHWEDGHIPDRLFSSIENRIYHGTDICWDWIVPTGSVLFRSTILETPLFKRVFSDSKIVVGDLPLFLTCAAKGYLYAFEDVFSVYRRHREGFTLNFDLARRIKMGEMWEEIPQLFGREFIDVSFFNSVYHYRNGMKIAIKNGDKNTFKTLRKRILKSYALHPKSGIKRIIKIIQER